MANKPMAFLDDVDFVRWMAVCRKRCLNSSGLLKEIVTSYINKTLTQEEYEKYLKMNHSPEVLSKLARKPINFDDKKHKNDVGAIKVSIVEESILGKKELPIKEVKNKVDVIDDNKVDVIDDNETIKKFNEFKKFIGGSMKEGSR